MPCGISIYSRDKRLVVEELFDLGSSHFILFKHNIINNSQLTKLTFSADSKRYHLKQPLFD